MKILLVIQTEKYYKEIDNALRLLGRIGFQLRLFVTLKERKRYERAIDDTNYHWYLSLSRAQVIAGQDPKEYCKRHGFDLMVTIPQEFEVPVERTERKILTLYAKIAKARVKFGTGEYKKKRSLGQGIVMERIL